MRGSFEITRGSVLQTETYVNSKLKFLVLNELREGQREGPTLCKKQKRQRVGPPKVSSRLKARRPAPPLLTCALRFQRETCRNLCATPPTFIFRGRPDFLALRRA